MAEEFVSLLPNNSTPLERAIEQVFSDSLPSEQAIKTLWDADSIPSNLLGVLAWSLSVDDWQHDWPDSVKREVIKASHGVHAQKGSVASIKAALAASGYPQAQVIENVTQQANWVALGGLYLDGSALLNGQLFSVETPPGSMTTHWAEYLVEFNLAQAPAQSADQAKLRKQIESIAPARCRLAALLYRFAQDFHAPIVISRPANTVEINFKACRSLGVHKPARIDGCRPLSGDSALVSLADIELLNGRTSLAGSMPIGDPLNHGWGMAGLSIGQSLSLQSAHIKRSDWSLGDTFYDDTLSGVRTLGAPILDESNLLNGAINLSLAALGGPFYVLLNGARTLGSESSSLGTSFFINATLHANNTQHEVAL
jgi:phage tail P2-like protein